MRKSLPFAMSLLLAAAACGPGQVVVTMEIQTDNPDGGGTSQLALSDIEVQLLPFDRDAVFDSLTQAYPEPEPEVPAGADGGASGGAAGPGPVRRGPAALEHDPRHAPEAQHHAWSSTTADEAQYLVLFREFQDFDGRALAEPSAPSNAAFDTFDSLQQGTIHASDSIRILQDNWADEAFADVGRDLPRQADGVGSRRSPSTPPTPAASPGTSKRVRATTGCTPVTADVHGALLERPDHGRREETRSRCSSIGATREERPVL